MKKRSTREIVKTLPCQSRSCRKPHPSKHTDFIWEVGTMLPWFEESCRLVKTGSRLTIASICFWISGGSRPTVVLSTIMRWKIGYRDRVSIILSSIMRYLIRRTCLEIWQSIVSMRRLMCLTICLWHIIYVWMTLRSIIVCIFF